jgi:GT2 family glycosyltransferase
VYLDDDCRPEAGWALALRETLLSRPDVDFVSGHVGGHDQPPGDYLAVTVYPVEEERLRHGRWTRPWEIGFGVCMAIRRSMIERLAGWDERLGPGASFPAADDMDFNYRLLKAGGRALATPHPRAHHHQWRAPEELGPLFRGYMVAWSAFAMKHLRTGDVVGGLWLWYWGLLDVARLAGSAVRRRSWLRLRVAAYKLHGIVTGTVRGLTYRW